MWDRVKALPTPTHRKKLIEETHTSNKINRYGCDTMKNRSLVCFFLAIMLLSGLALSAKDSPTAVKQIAVAPLSDNRLQLWAIDDENHLWYCTKATTETYSGWAAWSRFDETPEGQAVAPLPDGSLQLWTIDVMGQLWTCYQTSRDSNAKWTTWSKFLYPGSSWPERAS